MILRSLWRRLRRQIPTLAHDRDAAARLLKTELRVRRTEADTDARLKLLRLRADIKTRDRNGG